MAIEQDNGAIVRRLWDVVWNRGELDAIDDLVDDDFTNFGIRRSGGRAAMRHIVTVWRTAFPDLRYDIDEEGLCGANAYVADGRGRPAVVSPPGPW